MNFSRYLKRLTARPIYLISLLATIIIGIVVGAFFNTRAERFFAAGSVVDFYVNALTGRGSLIGLSFARLFTDVCLALIFFACSFVAVLIPIYYIILFYRGYVIGLAAVIFFSNFGVNGVMLFIFGVFIADVVSCLSLVGFAVLVAGNKNQCRKDKNERFYLLMFCIAAAFVAILVELLMLSLFLRPLNHNF
ncbi:MAG: hypothetical protein J5762_06000 [Clostridia bacterium]|nr:hypothetical protein [Clostridia bacterium]